MNKLLWSSSLALVTAAFFTACGDETTNVNEITGPTSVAKFKDLGDCTADNSGDMVYVKDEASVYFCADSVWKEMNASVASGSDGKNGSDGKDGSDGKNGADGKNGSDGKDGKDGNDGKDGTSCTATAVKENSGFELSCGGKVIGTISNGTNGTDGLKGADGKSCVGKKNEDGSVLISCDGKEVATIKNGENGKSAYELSGSKLTQEEWLESLKVKGDAGENCTAKSVEGGVEITCNGESKTIKNGTDGSSCEIVSDKDGVVTLKCGDVETELYKAMCGKTPYDPAKKFCYDMKQVLSLCGGEVYDPELYECVENKPRKKTIATCGEQEYDSDTHFCAMKGKTVMGVYKKVTIGTGDNAQIWMAENLNYKPDNGISYCYGETDDDPKTENCDKYGRLYTWATAVGKSEETCGYGHKCDDLGTGYVQGICPDGWHLPSVDEWKKLVTNVDPDLGGVYDDDNVAAEALKDTTTAWIGDGQGTNTSGFSALPAGRFYSGLGHFLDEFSNEGIGTSFWSVNEGKSSTDEAEALSLDNGSKSANMGDYGIYKAYGLSVRCIKDKE